MDVQFAPESHPHPPSTTEQALPTVDNVNNFDIIDIVSNFAGNDDGRLSHTG